VQVRYRRVDCAHEFPVEITEAEYRSSLEAGHAEHCSRCGQVVGKGHVTCRECGMTFVLEFPHWHVLCDLAVGPCLGCAARYISLCIC
jgi:hypothetical protein